MIGLAVFEVRAANNSLAAFAALSGIIFAAVGIGLILTLRHGLRQQSADAALRQQRPDAPWLWRSDWASGHIFSEGGANAAAAWLLATFWNAIAWPIFYFIYFDPNQPFPALAGFEVVSMILPLSGIVLIGLAVRSTLRWVAARGSYFEMLSIPGRIGGELTGTVRLMPPSRANREFKAVLSCVARKAGGSAEEHELYRDEHTIRGSAFGGVGINFQLPPEAHPTSTADPDNIVSWRLTVKSPFSTRAFDAQFEVPVFEPGPNSERTRVADDADERATGSQGFVPPPNFPVRQRLLPSGATEFYFPPCRAPAAAVGATLFTAGWSAMFLMILHIDAPIIFDVVWAAFDIFMLFWVGSLWFGDTRVLLDGTSISVSRGVPGLTLLHHTVPASEVHSLTAVVGSRTSTTTYYRLRLIYGNNRRLIFGDGLKDKGSAEWLAHEIAGHLGVA